MIQSSLGFIMIQPCVPFTNLDRIMIQPCVLIVFANSLGYITIQLCVPTYIHRYRIIQQCVFQDCKRRYSNLCPIVKWIMNVVIIHLITAKGNCRNVVGAGELVRREPYESIRLRVNWVGGVAVGTRKFFWLQVPSSSLERQKKNLKYSRKGIFLNVTRTVS